MTMLSPGGIDTPFNYGKWNADRKEKSPLSDREREEKRRKKGQAGHELDEEQEGVIGNLSHLLANFSSDTTTTK